MTNVRRPASKECWYWPSSVFHDLVTFFGLSVSLVARKNGFLKSILSTVYHSTVFCVRCVSICAESHPIRV
jgi:hypothetical protein